MKIIRKYEQCVTSEKIKPHCACPEKFEHSQIRLKVCETTEGRGSIMEIGHELATI